MNNWIARAVARQSAPATAVLAAVLTAVLAAGCAPGAKPAAPKTKAPSAVKTDPAALGRVTLTVWDQEVRGGQRDQIEALNKSFHEKYPNITIKRVSRSFDDLKKTLKSALSGNAPPDVIQANQGYGDMGDYVKKGHLLPLDSYAAAYGWRQRWPKGLLDLNSFTPDGKNFGTGNLYGVSQGGEIVGVYVNKEKLSDLGITRPRTWTEFEQALATAKARGELPIALGNLDKYPAIHDYGVLQAQLAGRDAVRNLVFGKGGAWTDPANVAAANKLDDWNKLGYLTTDANGTSYDKAWQDFAAGKGVFLIAGTWLVPDLQEKMGDKVGFMLPPPASAGATPVTTGGQTLPWAITAKSPRADAAAAYINYITTPQAMDVLVANDVLPAVRPASAQMRGGLATEMQGAWQAVSDSDGLVPYLDYSTTTFYDAFSAALQELLGRRKDGQEAMRASQEDYEKFQRNK
jgi:raffinose/stachyose/melibiose transport system substrate-binding protein